MQIDYSSDKPIFLQIAEGIEDAILAGAFGEEEQIPSITEFSVMYTINPATALKGVNLLVDSGIVYKKRGVGMFVATGACETLRQKRRDSFFDSYIVALVEEARRLQISGEDIKQMVDKVYSGEAGKGNEEQ